MDDDYIDEYVVARSAESYIHDIGFLSKFLELVVEIAKGKCVQECPSCGGRGDILDRQLGEGRTCEVCNGSGKVVWAITCRPYDPNEPVPEDDLDDISF
jgi:hypothetical protein